MPYKDPHSEIAKASGKRRSKKYASSIQGSFAYRFFSARDRCENKNNKNYKFYKDKKFLWLSLGEFKRDMFKSFLQHINVHGIKNTTIERIDNTIGYSKENCRWATRQEQSKNRRDTVSISFNGKTQCLTDWAKETGITRVTLWRRIFKYEWNIERVFSTPPSVRGVNQYSHAG